MSLFNLRAQVNGREQIVAATRSRQGISIETPGGHQVVRNVGAATRVAAEVLGPALDRAQRSNSMWGLYVEAGEVRALFGEWPPGDDSAPQLHGKRSSPATELSRIYDSWQRRDGTPVGALDAAAKIIEAYSKRHVPVG